MEKQIAEMAVKGCVRNPQAHTVEECLECEFKKGMCDSYRLAKTLYNDGYQQPKTGKWIPASTKPGVHAGMKCSLCKARISYSEHFNGQHLYCHKCGAKMKGD